MNLSSNDTKRVQIYDCTLREGAQAPHVSFTLEDKLTITRLLDDLGVAYIEGGWPAANPKDLRYFRAQKKLRLRQAKIVGFASTFRKGARAEAERNVKIFCDAQTHCAHVFGKAWDFHVTDVLNRSLEENLECIFDSIRYYKKYISEVSFGAEHVFDGYKENPAYVEKLFQTVTEAGADWIDLADTNGGSFPSEVSCIVAALRKATPVPLAIHCHNDNGCAVANAVSAIQHGVTIAEGTINGYAERCEMTDLCTLIPSLQLKLGYNCIPSEKLRDLTKVAREVAEITQIDNLQTKPYVGKFAFVHKAGLHVDAFVKNPRTYQHIDPALVGNAPSIVVSDQAGRNTIRETLKSLNTGHDIEEAQIPSILDEIKALENSGYQFDLSEPALELAVLKHLGLFVPHINLAAVDSTYRTRRHQGVSETVWDVSISFVLAPAGGRRQHFQIDNWPIVSLQTLVDKVIESVGEHFTEIRQVRLIDYRLRIINGSNEVPDKLRVFIKLERPGEQFKIMGFGANLIDAGLNALIDGLEYILHRQTTRGATNNAEAA